MSGASNTLAREFLTDVHQLCSAVAQRAEDEEESHMVALGEYLVRGRGFLLLSTLDFVIDQELTCREELLTLLLSLLPLVWKIPVQEDKAPDFTLPSLLEVFLCQEGRTIPQKAGQDRCDVQNSGKRLSGSSKSRRSRRTAQRYSVRDARKSQLSTSDSEANSDDKTTNTGSKHRRFHSSAVRVSCQLHQSNNPSQPASQHPTLDAMSTIEPSQPHRLFGSHTLDPNMLTDPTTLSIFNRMENSPFDLCHVLLSLLEKVCKFDMTINHNPGLAVSVVPTLTEILTEFGDCCGPGGGGRGGIDELAGGWTEEPVALVQRMLLRTILHLMFVDVGQNETLPDNLRRSLTDLFRATLKIRTCLERQADPFAPRPKKTLQEIQEDFSFSKYRHRALLLPELLEGVLQLLLGCLQASAPNPFFFSQSLELVHEFVQHRGLELFEATALRLEALAEARDSEVGSDASEHLRCLIAYVLKIISAVKRAKSEQLHQSVCARRRHRHCEYSYFLHHHRDLSGLPVSTFKQAARRNPFEEDSEGHDGEVRYPERCCCLAACVHQCLHLFQRLSPSGPAVLQVLAGVQAVGICCCMDPRSIIGPMLQAFQAPGLRSYQSHVLSVLSRLVLEQLGGGQPSEKAKLSSCNICTLDSSQLPGLEETLQGYGPKKESNLSTSHSPSYRSQGILPSRGAEDMLWKWDALEAYQEIVFGEDWHLSQQIAGHVCQLTLRGNAVVQWQLYTHIFNPVLQRGVELTHHAQQLGVSTTCSQVCSYHTNCLPVEVLLVYLQTLPALLKSSRVVRDLFLSCNGLNQITELIYLDCTRLWALKVFETLILNAWHHHVDSAVHEPERAEAQERESVLGLVEELSSRGAGEGPQSLTKFYEGLKEACPHPKGKSAFSAVGRNRGEAHLNTINFFLCVAFLCVSKEADSDRDSANDSEDTSGYDSTASEPLGGRLPCLSPDSVALPSKEQIRRAADVWSVCRWVYMSSPVFQRQFFRLGGLDVCSRLMTMVIQKLTSKIKDSKFKKKRESKGKTSPSHVGSPTQALTGQFDNIASAAGTEETHQHDTLSPSQAESKSSDPTQRLEDEWPLQSIRLLEALLAICLHSASSALQRFEPDLSFQLQSVEETLCEVRDQLSRSGVVNSELAVPLFDSLLHVALAEMFVSPDDIQEKPDKVIWLSVAPPAGDLSEEVDEAQVSGASPLGEEEGYDADSESNPEDSTRQEEVKSCGFSGVWHLHHGRLLFPEICLMELQLLASGSPDLEVLCHVLQSLLDAVKGHHNNAKLLYQQVRLLSHCQTILMELLVAMVSDRITAEELALLTRLFLEKTPPTEILLRGLLQIVEANADIEPLCFMSFPMFPGAGVPGLSSSPGMRPHGTAGGKGGVNTLLRGKLPLGRGEADLSRTGHLCTSPWHTAPFHLPLVGQNCWPHMASGFSASLWVRAGKDEDGPYKNGMKKKEASLAEEALHGPAHVTEQQTDRCLHVLSMGSKALMLQVWVNISTGAFTFRICIDPNDEVKAGLLAQAESGDGVLTSGRWQHVALTYTQQPEGKKNIHGQLTLWVGGIRKCDVSLDFTLPRKSSLSSDSNKTYCMLGHYQHSSEEQASPSARWDIGTLLLFNGSRIDTAEAFYLYASGPDLTSIMPCKYGKPHGTLSKYVTQEGLQCEQIRELLMRNTDVDIAPLIESLAVVYAPSTPSLYTIYEPVIRLKGQAKSAMASQRPFSAKEVQSSILEPPFLRTMMPCQALGLHSVLHKIGGTGAFVFLFARAVELSDCEETQALALQLLLSLVKNNQHRTHEMECYNGYSMIHQVLIKPKCIVGYHVLKTLLDGCCSGSILTIGEDGQFHLDAESTVVLQDLRLLSEILLDWKIWAKAQCGVWETLLTALEILIRVHHPQQMFNIRQLLKAQVVHRFLLACQVLQEHRDEYLTSIPQEVCLSFVKIIQEVLGSPPDLDLLRLLYNFLLAVHPPTNTYVCHTPTSFYFSLHIDGKLYQEKVQSMMYLWQSSSSVLSLSPSVFTETPAEGNASLKRSMGPSLHSSPALTPRLTHGSVTGTAEPEEGTSWSTQQDLGSTETLKRGGDELLSSCESAKTICDSQNVGGDDEGSVAGTRTPSISVEEEHDGPAGSPPDSDDHFNWTSEEAPRRPDSLKGIQSFQRSHSNLASLGLAFPAQNGSLTIARWPTVADRAAPPDDWESYTYSPGYDRHSKTDSSKDRSSAEDCLVLICCGLYDLLRGVLLLLPDLLLEEVMDKLIQPEALLVLVNHSSPLIQQGVMKLLDAYFSRAQKEQKEKFLKNHGFSLLANQLYLHQGSQGLLECFLEMLLGRPVGIEEDLDLEDMENISPFRKRCIIPVLGLLENSLYENSLVHNSLCLLLQLLNACPKLADILLDHGLLYVLFNTLSTLNGLENGIPPNDYKLVVCDIQQLLVAVTIHSCSSSGSQYFRIIEDLITLLGYMQTSKVRRTQEMATALQFRVVQAAIDFIKTTANQDPQKSSSYVHVPTSPHHALQPKRRSIAGRRRFTVAQSDSLMTRMRSVASDELNQMMQRRMSQENPIRASETELVQRLQRLVVLAVNRLIYQDIKYDFFDFLNFPESPDHSMSVPLPGEHTTDENDSTPSTPIPPGNIKSFRKDILKLMMEGIKIGLGSTGRGGAPRQQWKRILWSCRDTFRVQIGRMLVHTLSPAVPLEDRKEALEFVHEQSYSEILRESLSPSLEHGPKLALYLYELLHDHRDALSKEEQAAANTFMTALKLCGHRCIPPSAPAKPDLLKAIKEEQLKYESEARTSKGAWEKKLANTEKSLLQRLDGKSKDISKIAADVTQNVSLRQGMERKKVMQHIRGLYKTDLSASRHWQELVQQLTHDRAVWYDQSSYPTSWQLDPTEGPNRERRRLQRCYLTIPNKYLLKDRHKLDGELPAPLAFLFEDKTHSSSSIVKDKATSEPIRFTRKCVSVAPSRETAGELLLGKSGMYFVEDNVAETFDNQVSSFSPHGETEPASFSWTYEEIKEVHKRWWQLRDNAMEIFLTNGRTLLLAFDTTKFRDDVYHNILSSELPNLLEYGNISALTHLWSSGQITNFEYLTHLNKHAGRSFNDLMQYPVFPFILRDYTSETLDLQDTSIYRILSKPIAVQSKEKEDRYVDNYRYLEEEYKKGKVEDDPMPPVQPYHYGSHYSNSGTVLHFLVRLPPFTKMFLAYQDQSFDIPDRTFHSMNTTWRLSSYESMTDVKELIPEFFYLPEFLVNREGFDFGVRQNSERVNHVNLPPWARNDPRLFILIHRQALESDQVSQTLCQWIDLVFGLKQKGKAAVHAINVFHPATYFGMDVSAVEDPVQRRALETMIKTYGQTPRQLFSASHISRAGTKLLSEAELPAAMGLLVQLAFRESREQPKDTVYPSPLPWIKGLKWGEYVGSPSAPDPVVCFSQPHGEHFGSLLALPTRAICGLSRKFCLMMIYSKEQGVRSMHSTDIQWSAILSWGYTDNMLRLKSKQSEPPINFIQCSPLHQVTSCAWVPDSCQLFTGSKCGVITAYSNRFTTTMPTEMEVETQVHLYGHTAEVTGLFVCKPYSILISVSRDGTCILWDLNRLCYVQSLTGHKSPVNAVSASETTGDIATVCDSVGGGSDLRLWTINGDLIGHVHCREIICSVAFSNQPEGMSVNVIAGGLENGVVRLWSTWDLKPVREITFPKSNRPIRSLTFSCDGHHLYTTNSEGTVIAWCRRDQQRMKLPMFYSFLSSYAAG
uniref:Lysosomal trafficking regulator n=1 Tax=Cyprinus carpio carpio TaxID=630221 RepID=A0A9J8B834_CYPCA